MGLTLGADKRLEKGESAVHNMKRIAVIAVLAATAMLPLAARAEDNRDHIELGAFADYVRLHHANDANLWGVGGRFGVGVASHVNLEAEMAYDFENTITNTFRTTVGTTTVTTTQRNPLRLWHGTFGPMIWFGSKHARVFAVLKGGFLNFSVSSAPVTGGTIGTTVAQFSDGDTNGVFYPGGGVEFSIGPLGLRVDVGDLMYFDNGANHNLSVKFGPTIHF
jgi:hypothetical protein